MGDNATWGISLQEVTIKFNTTRARDSVEGKLMTLLIKKKQINNFIETKIM